MEIFFKTILILGYATTLILFLFKLDKLINNIASMKTQILLHSLLYAVVFTPTAYHHAPNTIIAPLHLSTIGGNLFYAYEYTFSMFAYGVLLPTSFGFALIWTVLTALSNRSKTAI